MGRFCVIRKEGGSRVLTITKLLPSDWVGVNIDKVKENKRSVTLKIEKVG